MLATALAPSSPTGAPAPFSGAPSTGPRHTPQPVYGTPQPGMMQWEDVQVQLIDTPPITADFFDTNLLGLIRGSDLALLLFD